MERQARRALSDARRLADGEAHGSLGEERRGVHEVLGLGLFAQQERNLRTAQHNALHGHGAQHANRRPRRLRLPHPVASLHHGLDRSVQACLQRGIDGLAPDAALAEGIDVERWGAFEAEHADTPPAAAGHLIQRRIDHAEDRTARGFRDRGKPDVGGVARDDEKVDALPQPRGRLDELWIDLHRDDRTIVGGDAHGQAAVIPDHHRRIAGVPALGYQLLRELVHARLEVHRRLRAHAAQYPDGLHRVTAMASISISMPSIAKRLIWMSVLAGLLSLKYSLRTSLTFGLSSKLAR